MATVLSVVQAPAPDRALLAASLRGVRREFSDSGVRTAVLKGVDLDLAKGASNVILGASGSGKTTLLNILGGIDRADAGEVWVGGQDLRRAKPDELVRFRQERVGFIFQFYNLMPTLTARENVEVALEHKRLPLAQRRAAADEMLAAVGLASHRHKFPSQMSGGEQQRVAVARALSRRPELILCDEPTGNLDAEAGRLVVELIDKLRRELSATAIIVTHNPELFPAADRVIRIKDGVVA